MGIKILERLYGNGFDNSTLDLPNWLLGNVGDWLKAKFVIEAGVDYVATINEPIYINVEEKTLKLMNGKKWSYYGFDIGSEVTVEYVIDETVNDVLVTTPVSFEIEIMQLYNDTLVYDNNGFFGTLGVDMIPTNSGTKRIYAVKLFVQKEIEGIRVKYNHISNEEIEGHSLSSFIDGNQTEAYYVGLNTLGVSIAEMQLINNQSGMSIKSMKIKKVDDAQVALRGYFNLKNIESAIKFNGLKTNHAAQVIPMNRINGTSPPFSNILVPSYVFQIDDNYTTAITTPTTLNQVFFDNRVSGQFGLMYLHLKINVFVIDMNNERPDGGINFRPVLLRFEGVAREYKEKIQITEWQIPDRGFNLSYSYDNITSINIKENSMYVFALEFQTGNIGENRQREIYFRVDSGFLELKEQINDTPTYKKKYELDLEFMLSSFFEETTDLENNIIPANLFNANSLTDVIDIKLLPRWNNPNIFITNDLTETERLGNTGWFNENFNGLPNELKVRNINYYDLGGQNIGSLSFTGETKVVIEVENQLQFSNTLLKYGFGWLPEEEAEYKDLKTPFYKNVKINSNLENVFEPEVLYPNTYEGYSNDEAKMNVRAIKYTIINNVLRFEAIFTPTGDFTTFFESRPEDRKYLIWLSISDGSLKPNFSDRVSLLIDVNDLNSSIKINGELPGVENKFIEHPEDNTVVGSDIYEGFIGDDILSRMYFQLEKGKRINQIILGYEVENTITGLTFELERYTANLNQYITIPDGTQEINFNSVRGFKMASNNNKNWVKIIRENGNDELLKAGYVVYFGQIIRYEEWIQKTGNVPTEFYDNSLPFNGMNNNWLSYLKSSNYKINFFALFDVVENGELVRYKNKFEIRFNDYESNDNLIITHQYFDNETNALLNVGNDPETGRPLGALLSNKNTRIEITYQKINGSWDINNVYATTSIEISNGAGEMERRYLSSILDSETDNILIPVSGSQRLKVEEIAGNKIKTSCLVDYTRLSNASKYMITGRIGCFENNNGIPINKRIYSDNYELKYE